MKCWILYKRTQAEISPEAYEINHLLDRAAKHGVEACVVKPDQVELIVTREGSRSILLDGEPTEVPDFVLPRMGAGTTYFALAVIRHLERLGVHCINSAASIEAVKDKLLTQQILAAQNLPVPKTMLVKFPVDSHLVEKHLGFPVVVKSLSGSQGKGVFLSESRKSFADLVQLIEASNPTANIILQEFVSDSYGQDLRVVTIGGRAIACMKRSSADGDFKANFSAGGSVEAYELTPEIEWLALQASSILGLDIAGVDLLFAGDHFKICEVNSSPGFQGLERCCALDVASEIYQYVNIRLGTMFEDPPSGV